MKKLISKFKKQPLPVKLLVAIMSCWIYPFIESIVTGATGWYDLSIVTLILISIGLVGLAYAAIFFLIIPVGGWCLSKLGIIKKKKK